MSLEDTVYIATSVFTAGLVLVLGLFIYTQILAVPQLNNATMSGAKTALLNMDGVILFGLIGLALAAITLAYFIPSHPAFFFTWFLNTLFALVLTPFYANAYAQIAVTPILNAAFLSFPLTAATIGNLPLIAFVISTLIAIASYGKNINQGGTIGL